MAALESRPARGAWVEIQIEMDGYMVGGCRAPQGARGLKCEKAFVAEFIVGGRAPQGARGLKYCCELADQVRAVRRAPQGARGLKSVNTGHRARNSCRAPQGARGLNCQGIHRVCLTLKRRAPQGARGLKFYGFCTLLECSFVAPRKGRVD